MAMSKKKKGIWTPSELVDKVELHHYFLRMSEISGRFIDVGMDDIILGRIDQVFPDDRFDPHATVKVNGAKVRLGFASFHRTRRVMEHGRSKFRVPQSGEYVYFAVRALPPRGRNANPQLFCPVWGYVDELSFRFLVPVTWKLKCVRKLDYWWFKIRKRIWRHHVDKKHFGGGMASSNES